ncbi:MAG: MarR family winged helix-turn-helix transcriptional regulator [Alphaproteobacteria bacterium]
MAAKEAKRRERVRLLAALVEEIGRVQAAHVAAGARLHGPDGAAAGRRAILRQLRDEGPLTVPDLARLRGVSRQYVQTVVNDLVAAGHVDTQPNPGHRRSPFLIAAEAGCAHLDEAARREEPFAETVAAAFKRSELADALDLLQRLRTTLDTYAPENGASDGDVPAR